MVYRIFPLHHSLIDLQNGPDTKTHSCTSYAVDFSVATTYEKKGHTTCC